MFLSGTLTGKYYRLEIHPTSNVSGIMVVAQAKSGKRCGHRRQPHSDCVILRKLPVKPLRTVAANGYQCLKESSAWLVM